MLKRSCQQMLAEANAVIETINYDEAKKRMDAAQSLFVDVRDATELQQHGRIPDAVHIPRGLLEFMVDPDDELWCPEVTVDTPLILFCAVGGRSALAVRTLMEMGFNDVCHIGGGFEDWKERGGPTVGGVEPNSSTE